MKWLPPDGGVQHTADKRYCIMRATTEPENWIAYAFSQFRTIAEKLGEMNSASDAREVCEEHEVLRKRA